MAEELEAFNSLFEMHAHLAEGAPDGLLSFQFSI